MNMARKKGDRDDSDRPGRRRDPRDLRIERLRRDKAKLIEERDHWKRRSEQLEKELEAARRAGKRLAAPFAKDRRQGSGERPGRRCGADYGKQGRRQPPPRVDEVHAVPVPTSCPDCGGAIAVDGVSSQYQEELPPIQALVRRFDIEVGHCSQCRRRVQGPARAAGRPRAAGPLPSRLSSSPVFGRDALAASAAIWLIWSWCPICAAGRQILHGV